MHRFLRHVFEKKIRTGVWLILVLVGGLAFPPVVAAGPYGKIELLRDQWGVPHVFAETDAGAMYGLGWATAEDRAFQMYYNLRIIQGRLAELIGDVKVGVTQQRPDGSSSALRNDVTMRVTGFYRAAQQVARHLDRQTLALLRAYSEGVNDYLARHRAERLYLFDRLGLDPEPWAPADCIASWWRLGQFFAGDGLRDMEGWYSPRAPPPNVKPDDAASVIQRGDVPDRWVAAVRTYAARHGLVPPSGSQHPGARRLALGAWRFAPNPAPSAKRQAPSAALPRFSHAWVVGGKVSTTGSAVLVSDPQTPVRNPSLLYEFHVVGKSFNARGIGVAGSPIILIGFTPDVAWGMTALGADQADLFVLKTDPHRPDQYLFDGKWLPMATRRETIRVKGGEPRTLVVRETRFGPVVTELATGVRPGDEVALKRVPLCEPDRETIQGALAMVRARDAEAFRRALHGWRFPSANCVFGDRRGNIGYMTALALPVRASRAGTLRAAEAPGGDVAHEGWLSGADWQGFLPGSLLPQVVNPSRGWIVSANHRPIASFYPISLGISTGSLGDTDRSWRLKERLAARKTFAPKDVLDIQYDTVSAVKRDLVRLGYHLRDTLKAELSEETQAALRYLEPWRDQGSRLEMSIPGTEILNLMPLAFRQNLAAPRVYGGGLSGLCFMLKTIDARLAENPRGPLREEEAEYVDLILRAAWRYGKASFGDDPSRWNERGREQMRETRLGYMETLDGFPSLDPSQDLTLPDLRCVDGGTILSQRAQSYTQYVRLDDADEALALLPVGQSEHPGSNTRLSGYALWAKGELRPAPLSRAKVERYAISRTLLGPERPPQGRAMRALGAWRLAAPGKARSAKRSHSAALWMIGPMPHPLCPRRSDLSCGCRWGVLLLGPLLSPAGAAAPEVVLPSGGTARGPAPAAVAFGAKARLPRLPGTGRAGGGVSAPPADRVQIELRRSEAGFREYAVSFPSPVPTQEPRNGVVHLAYWVPHGAFPAHPAVLVLHSLGVTRARTEENLCAYLANRGIAAALLTLPYHLERRPPGIQAARYLLAPDPERMVGFFAQGSADLSAAVTWLSRRPEIDNARIGLVGISLGAVVGGLAMARDERLRAAVLLLGGGDVAHILARGALTLFRRREYRRHGLDEAALRRALAPVDPLTYARPLAPPRRMLMINGRHDLIIPHRDTVKLWRAFGEPPLLWLETGHYGPSLITDELYAVIGDFLDAAFADRLWRPPRELDAFTLRVGLFTGYAPILTPAVLLDLGRLARRPDLRVEAGLRSSGPLTGLSLGLRPGLDAFVGTYLFRGHARARAFLFWHAVL